jgi:hypothetical protein
MASGAEECTQASSPIETDRPDTTNSAIVVPVGSLENENGINISRQNGADIFDGTNSRWRLGIAPCLEVLVDVPNYVGTFRGLGPSGFGDLTPAVKWQVSPILGKFDISVTAGAACPRARPLSRVQVCNPTCNFLGQSNLVVAGRSTAWRRTSFMPSSPTVKFTNQSTFVIDAPSCLSSMSATIRSMVAPATCSIPAAATESLTTNRSISMSGLGSTGTRHRISSELAIPLSSIASTDGGGHHNAETWRTLRSSDAAAI